MRVPKNIMVRLRMQRRRHRHVLIALAVVVFILTSFLFFVWQDGTQETLRFVIDPHEKCGPLPAFFCSWTEFFGISSKDKPFDPSTAIGDKPQSEPNSEPSRHKPVIAGSGSSPRPLPEKDKLNHIMSYYKGSRRETLALGHTFYKGIFKDIIQAKPRLTHKLDRYLNGARCTGERYADDQLDPIFSESFLSSFLQLNETEIDALTESHKFIVDRLPRSAPSGLYENDGIVFVGGGKFNWLTLLSIRALRGSGCQLPVEVLIPTLEEYELNLCSKIFPAMDARCIYLPTALYGDDLNFGTRLSFQGYQYKCLAILLSSFENVLLLDSDNIAAYSPDHLFKSEPFLSNGLVVWPDYWRRSTSPSFYKIAGIDVSKTKLLPRYSEGLSYYKEQTLPDDIDIIGDFPYHERMGAIPDPSTESGQLMISKKTHLKALLLALYYNSYGPNYYYPIFSQGAQGEGDKETFLAATTVLKQRYYQVGKFLSALGNFKNGDFKGHAMGQYDPVADYEANLRKGELMETLSGDELDVALKAVEGPKMLFLHANFPKLDPWALKNAKETVDGENRYRLYGLSMRWRSGTDLEADIWNHMNTLLCDIKLDIDHFKEVDRNALCKEIKEQQKFLRESASKLE